MKNIRIFDRTRVFAENKDVARDIRIKEIIPALNQGEEVILDFEGVDTATQSFVHALLSDLLRKYGADVLGRITFKSCGTTVRKMIEIVSEYTQEGMGAEQDNDLAGENDEV